MTPELRAALAEELFDVSMSEFYMLAEIHSHVDALAPIIDAAITKAIRTEAIQWAAYDVRLMARSAREALLAASDDLERLLRDGTPQDEARRDVVNWLRARAANGGTT